jgi:hypothetical protein
MDQSIADFYKTVTKRGFARTNLFRIKSISRNGATSSDIYQPSADGSDNLFLYNQDGTIPSRNISTTTVDFKTFKYTIPMVANYPESSGWVVTFYCDRDYKLRNIFEKWSVDTFDEHTSLSNVPNWWDCNIELELLTNSGSQFVPAKTRPTSPSKQPYAIRKYMLVGAFLQNVGSMAYETKSGGDIAKLTATIGFQYITSQDLIQP